MWSAIKQKPSRLLFGALAIFIAVINWPWAIAILVVVGAIVVFDEILHWPSWLVSIIVNVLLIGTVLVVCHYAGITGPVFNDDPPQCSTPGCD